MSNKIKVSFFGKRILIEKSNLITTESGIYLPTAEVCTGKVLSVGDACERVNVGDVVIYAKQGATELTIEGDTYLLYSEDHLMGKVKDGETLTVTSSLVL